MLIALMWGFSGSLKLFDRGTYSSALAEIVIASGLSDFDLPDLSEYILIDYEVKIEDGSWHLWKEKVPTIDIDP